MREATQRRYRKALVLGAVTSFLAVASYFLWTVELARSLSEREALARAIAQLGGRYSLDTDFQDPPLYGPPAWLQSIIGEDYFTNIVSINLGMASIDDSMVERLGRLEHLQSLGIWQTRLGDENLSNLMRLTELETLDISQTNVTDDGLKQLSAMQSMRVLVVGGNRLTDSGLESLKQMSQLTLLCVVGNQFSQSARRSLEQALPDATVVFVPLPQMAGESVAPRAVVPGNPLERRPAPQPNPPPAKGTRPGQFI